MHGGGRHHHHHRTTVSLNLKNLRVKSVLGRGAKGVVFLVETEKAELLALKTVLKSSIEKEKIRRSSHGEEQYNDRRICFEREVLSSFDHPLLPKLHGVLTTDKLVGYAIDYCPGGDLNSLRKRQTEKMFSDDVIRFYAAELVLALEYLHGLGIIYRDLKPENIMIQASGHLMLVDFDLSTNLAAKPPDQSRSVIVSEIQPEPEIKPKHKKNLATVIFHRRGDSEITPDDSGVRRQLGGGDSAGKSNSFVGTEDYLAPEMIQGYGHDSAVDWWCLGVTLYEMLYSMTPFRGANRRETYHRILTQEPKLTGELTPLRDLIGKLLEKDPNKRIRVDEIKGHRFFNAVDWRWITEMPRPPFIPEVTDVGDMNGNMEIDLEEYVQGVFKVREEGKMGNNEKMNKDAWVDDNNNPNQVQESNFLVF